MFKVGQYVQVIGPPKGINPGVYEGKVGVVRKVGFDSCFVEVEGEAFYYYPKDLIPAVTEIFKAIKRHL